jgi:hypothetical protein
MEDTIRNTSEGKIGFTSIKTGTSGRRLLAWVKTFRFHKI